MNIMDDFNPLDPFEPPKYQSAHDNISYNLGRTAAHAAVNAVIDGLSRVLPNPYLVQKELGSNNPNPPSPRSRTADKPEKPDTPDIRTMQWDGSDLIKFDYLPHPDQTNEKLSTKLRKGNPIELRELNPIHSKDTKTIQEEAVDFDGVAASRALTTIASLALGVMTGLAIVGIMTTPAGWAIAGAALCIGLVGAYYYGGVEELLTAAFLGGISAAVGTVAAVGFGVGTLTGTVVGLFACVFPISALIFCKSIPQSD